MIIPRSIVGLSTTHLPWLWRLKKINVRLLLRGGWVYLYRAVDKFGDTVDFMLSERRPDKQQIVCSRSFSRRLTEYQELSEALSEFCSRAAEKLRKQQSVTGCITVFIRTSPFNPKEPQYQRAAGVKLDAATQDTRAIIATANRMLKEIFRTGYNYQKCGVQLSHIQPESSPGQIELFDFADDNLPTENRPLMKIVDQINRRFPRAISVAATGFDKVWKSKSERVSPHYTTLRIGGSWFASNEKMAVSRE